MHSLQGTTTCAVVREGVDRRQRTASVKEAFARSFRSSSLVLALKQMAPQGHVRCIPTPSPKLELRPAKCNSPSLSLSTPPHSSSYSNVLFFAQSHHTYAEPTNELNNRVGTPTSGHRRRCSMTGPRLMTIKRNESVCRSTCMICE